MRDANLNNLNAMQAVVPSFKMTDNSVVATSIYIRGIGSGSNDGFEQSVGLFIDEIYGGRGCQFRSPFLDLARVEVLRGPQGSLFGKNTIAGAINITTARPTQEFERQLDTYFSPLDLLVTYTLKDEFEQTSHEFQLSSSANDKLEWVVGAYYQESDYETGRRSFLNGPTFSAALQTRSQVLDGLPLSDPLSCDFLDSAFSGLLAGGAAGLGPILADLSHPSRSGVLVTLACQIAGFSQADYT